MATRNAVTGDPIRSKRTTKAFREGMARIAKVREENARRRETRAKVPKTRPDPATRTRRD